MPLPTFTREELDHFAQVGRPGVQKAKDLCALASENFRALDRAQSGEISSEEIEQFAGNPRLREFLYRNMDKLAGLSFSARNLLELLLDWSARPKAAKDSKGKCAVSCSDLKTFSWLSVEFNRRCFYDGNFQNLREAAGMQTATLAFLAGVLSGGSALASFFSKLNLPPSEAIACAVIATVGIPLCGAVLGYLLGTKQADRYFQSRIERIDRMLECLEQD